MKADYNKLITEYGQANLEFIDLSHIKIPAGAYAKEQRTRNGVCAFVLPLRGKAEFILEGAKLELKEGLILHAGARMKLSKKVIGDGPWEYIVLHYRVLGESIQKKQLENTNYTLNIGTSQYAMLHTMLRQLKESHSTSGELWVLNSKAVLYSLVEFLLRTALRNETASEEGLIRYSVSYIKQNIHKNITVFHLAEHVNMNYRRFTYLFHKVVGTCPKKYITQCMIDYARELLVLQEYSVTDIAKMVGYEDVFQFSRIFKKYTGLSPSLFREEFVKNP